MLMSFNNIYEINTQFFYVLHQDWEIIDDHLQNNKPIVGK